MRSNSGNSETMAPVQRSPPVDPLVYLHQAEVYGIAGLFLAVTGVVGYFVVSDWKEVEPVLSKAGSIIPNLFVSGGKLLATDYHIVSLIYGTPYYAAKGGVQAVNSLLHGNFDDAWDNIKDSGNSIGDKGKDVYNSGKDLVKSVTSWF
ncbi:MAG: hypothetical protein GY845_35410 [Planctomycetes bacterium]|nr:hypothetical protein [Planctomycetota bacterium]